MKQTEGSGWASAGHGVAEGVLKGLVLHGAPLWSPPEMDGQYQRAEVSHLNKVKSMSRADGDDRKIYQGPSKINIWTE